MQDWCHYVSNEYLRNALKKEQGLKIYCLCHLFLIVLQPFLIFYRQIIGISVCRKRAILRFEGGTHDENK